MLAFRAMIRRRVLVGFGLVLCAVGCKSEAPAKAPANAAQDEPPPAITITAERTDVVYSYVRGAEFATASRIDDIPEASRKQVVVTDLSLSPEERKSDRFVYLADLSQPRSDGTFAVAIASRYGFEAGHVGTTTVTEPASASAGVVIYTTSWCGVCKKAKRLLDQLGVPFVEKDVEGSKKAATELAAKASAAGIRPGGVPVIDVAGTLLQGLDEPTLRATLKTKGLL